MKNILSKININVDANYIFWARKKFAVAIILHPQFYLAMPVSNFLENKISTENWGYKKVAKAKCSRAKKKEIDFR